MGWTHDTGYDPAYDHEGYPLAVLDDDTETATHDHTTSERTVGWRAGCECGWRGDQFWPRAEFPSTSSAAPQEVDGFDFGGGVFAEWSEHLHTVLPALAVHDAAQIAEAAGRQLDQSVATARHAGASWTMIGAAAGLTRQSAYQRWSPNSGRAAKPTPQRTSTMSAAQTSRRPR